MIALAGMGLWEFGRRPDASLATGCTGHGMNATIIRASPSRSAAE